MGNKKFDIKKHVMTGISYMIPIVVCGGILCALAKGFGGYDIGDAVEAGATPFSNLNPFSWLGFWWSINKLGTYAMDFAVAVMTAGVAYSISGRPGIVPGMVIGYCSAQSKAGFLGGLLMAFIIGAFVNWMKRWKLPKWCVGLMPVMFIPVISTFVCGMIFIGVFSIPLAFIMDVFQQWIISLNGGAKAVIGAVIGACMGFDMGGPVNKTASMAANALGADGIYGPMSAKIIGGMTPPIGIFIATLISRKKFTKVEVETAKTALPMGLCFITEGVLPFAAADPARFIPSSMLGSAVAGAIAVGMGCESVAGHGGIFVVPMMTKPVWFLIALLIGSVVTGVVYAAIKRPLSEEPEVKEEESLDFDLDIQIQ
ncbi:MAG: PTS fructose transporter subunit IIC [Lachnospiraceae bacterium]